MKELLYLPFGLMFALLRRGHISFKGLYYRRKYGFDKSVRIGYETLLYGDIKIGEGTYIQRNCTITGKVNIGKYCAIAEGVQIWSQTHGVGLGAIHLPVEKEINIGNNVWIGVNVFIKEGVNIGNNVIIGANSVVTKDIENNMVVGGVPTRVIKKT